MAMSSEGEAAGRRVDAYLETIKRLEPDISVCDRDATLTSIAISLKRIADLLENKVVVVEIQTQTPAEE